MPSVCVCACCMCTVWGVVCEMCVGWAIQCVSVWYMCMVCGGVLCDVCAV